MKQKRLSIKERQAQILKAARTLFARSGYAEVTLDEIAAKCGISRPRVIQIFGCKQNIYEAIAEEAYASHPLDKDLAPHIEKGDDYEVFRTFADHILRHTADREDREIFKILNYARLKEDRFHHVHFHKKDTLMIGRISEYVADRVNKGIFKQMDPRTIVFCYQAMISNLAIYKNVIKNMDFVTIEELSHDCATIFLRGIWPEEESTEESEEPEKITEALPKP